jgi:phosphotransferase system enzyme I (PtsI)
MLDRERLAGLALGSGGPTSHIAILSRTLGVPAVLGLGAFIESVANGAHVGVDGNRGEVYIDPDQTQLEFLSRAVQGYTEERHEIAALRSEPATTPDGFHLEHFANIGSPADVEPALAAGAEGVGLFRTEFLVTGRATLPSEDEQHDIYRKVLDAMGKRTVIFRTFDIGGDKPVPALGLPSEANPFLGYRALRIGLDRTELLTTQMRAILRAAGGTDDHDVWIMLPMVATVDEVRQARALYEQARRGLDARARLGVMIEIPAAALNAAALAREVDFFSIGTNDLVQFTLAVDRLDERLASLYQPFHPAVLKLIKMTAEAANTAGKPCGVCGEMGGDPEATALLLGLGVTELSMSAGSLGYVKREVRRSPLADARRLAETALVCATAEEVRAAVNGFRTDHEPD